MTNDQYNSAVSSFQSLERETVKHQAVKRNAQGNNNETWSLRFLALQVLARNKLRNVCETTIQDDVSLQTISETSDIFAHAWLFQDRFEERAAIREFEAGFTKEEAERLAYQETLEDYVYSHHPSIKTKFETIIYSKGDSHDQN